MELVTVERDVCGGYKYELFCSMDESFVPDRGLGFRFRIILIESGTGIVRIGNRSEALSSPAILCINEQETPLLEKSLDIHMKAVYFDPVIINSRFNYENIRLCPEEFTQTELNDLQWLRPFIERNLTFTGKLDIGYVAAQQVSKLINSINMELNGQKDKYWPCRSRSYLLELLFLLERAFNETGAVDESILINTSKEINEIILYLHIHYMEKITIGELTKKYHMNRTTLCQKFLKETGMTIMSYLIKVRISLSALMLKDTSIPISEIMDRVAFKDYSHFNRMFRKHTGISPKMYRQKFYN